MRRCHFATHCANIIQSLQSRFNLLRCSWRFAMPLKFAFKFWNAFGGYSMDYNNGWFVKDRPSFTYNPINIAEIVTIGFLDMPIPSSPFVGQGIERHNIFGKTIYLDIVAIYYNG